MPSPFVVTAASNTVLLNDKRQGTTAFTVSNASGRALRGRALIVPVAQTDASWLTLVGPAERTYAIAGTEQVAVQIAVPVAAAADTYSFHLDVVGEVPDEDYTTGPTVVFTAVALPPPNRFPWWIVAVVAGLIVLATVGLLMWRNSEAVRAARVTATVSAEMTRAAADATATAQATLDAQATVNARATVDAQATLDAQATVNARATVDAQATVNARATVDAQATANARATVDTQATANAQATANVRATAAAQATVFAGATATAVVQATQTAVAVARCLDLADAVNAAQSNVNSLETEIQQLQKDLQDAAGTEKQAIVAEIRAKQGELGNAQRALENAHRALQQSCPS